MNRFLGKISASERLLTKLVDIEHELNTLPPLSILEKAQLEQSRAIEHLYYSSKLEGSNLNSKRIEQAIYGEQVSTAKN